MSKAEQKKTFVVALLAIAMSVIDIVGLWALINLITFVTTSAPDKDYRFFLGLFPGQSSRSNFVAEVIVITFIFIFKAIFAKRVTIYQQNLIAEINVRLQLSTFAYYLRKDFDFLRVDNLSILSHNVSKIFSTANSILPSYFVLISDGLLFILLIFGSLFLAPFVVLAILGFVGFNLLALRFSHRADFKTTIYERQKLEENRFKVIEETLLNLREIKVFARQTFFQAKFFDSARQHAIANKKVSIAQGMPVIYFEFFAVSSLLLVVSSVWRFQDSFEFLVGFLILFAGGVLRLLPSLNRMVIAVKTMEAESPMINLLSQISKDQESNCHLNASRRILGFQNRIEISDLSYLHRGTSAPLFKGLDLLILKGSRVCLTGKTGVGKSTLIDILMGLRPPNLGKVFVDGIDINCDIENWRKLVGYVPTNVVLIDSSIRNNVAFGVDESKIDDERVNQCIEVAQFGDYVRRSPDGLFSSVGERGSALSSGERQKVGLARALYFNPSVLILDEATSALDVQTEELIFRSLNNAVTDSLTILCVSHRPSTLKNFDFFYTLQDGFIHLSV